MKLKILSRNHGVVKFKNISAMFSYEDVVIVVKGGVVVVTDESKSETTDRHIREFLTDNEIEKYIFASQQELEEIINKSL
jgi:hypothetical protein